MPPSESQRLSAALDHSSDLADLVSSERVPSELVMDVSIRCRDYPEQRSDNSPVDRLSLILSRLLCYGVWLATAIVLLGGILYLIRHGAEPVNYQNFRGEPDAFRSPAGVFHAVLVGRHRGIIQLGLLVLIATPILRVIVSFCFFVRQREAIYVLITGLVLSGLFYSFLSAYF